MSLAIQSITDADQESVHKECVELEVTESQIDDQNLVQQTSVIAANPESPANPPQLDTPQPVNQQTNPTDSSVHESDPETPIPVVKQTIETNSSVQSRDVQQPTNIIVKPATVIRRIRPTQTTSKPVLTKLKIETNPTPQSRIVKQPMQVILKPLSAPKTAASNATRIRVVKPPVQLTPKPMLNLKIGANPIMQPRLKRTVISREPTMTPKSVANISKSPEKPLTRFDVRCIDTFCHCLAGQLKQIPEEDVSGVVMEIQNLVWNRMMLSGQKKVHHHVKKTPIVQPKLNTDLWTELDEPMVQPNQQTDLWTELEDEEDWLEEETPDITKVHTNMLFNLNRRRLNIMFFLE